MLCEIMTQAIANAGLLVTPLIAVAFNSTVEIFATEYVLYGLFWVSIVFETIADLQKQNFIRANKNKH